MFVKDVLLLSLLLLLLVLVVVVVVLVLPVVVVLVVVSLPLLVFEVPMARSARNEGSDNVRTAPAAFRF